MGKTDFIISLIKFRMIRAATRAGLSESEADMNAEAVISGNGLRGFFGFIKAIGTPDGALVTIVEHYVKHIKIHYRPSREIAWLSDEAIDEIESFRSKRWPGRRTYPKNLFDYVYYRIALEVQKLHGIDSDEMGLDRETIRLMTAASIRYFVKETGATGIDFASLTERRAHAPEPEPQHPCIPLTPTLPDVTSCRPLKAFEGGSGRYMAFFCQNVPTLAESKGLTSSLGGKAVGSLFEYPHVLAVLDSNTKMPIHFVTLERGLLLNTLAFCEFCSDGSHNLIDSEGFNYISDASFIGAALFRADQRLGTCFAELKAA